MYLVCEARVAAEVPVGELEDVGDVVRVVAREHAGHDVPVHGDGLHVAPWQPEPAEQEVAAAHDARGTERDHRQQCRSGGLAPHQQHQVHEQGQAPAEGVAGEPQPGRFAAGFQVGFHVW